ncbi:MAG: hypothetical protein AB7I38_18635 [Dehalococcoidia bacterium]
MSRRAAFAGMPEQGRLEDYVPPALHDAKTSRAVSVHAERESIASRFYRFNRQNPAVFDRLAELALEEHRAGASRLSIARLFEVMRHEGIRTQGDRYELNNDYRRPYSELLEEHYPEIRGKFEHRRLRAA